MSANSERKTVDLISRAQIQIIKIGQKELGIDEDDYRSMLMAQFGVSSCTQLSRTQATQLIERLQALGFETRKRTTQPPKRQERPHRAISREGGNVVRLASVEELAKIDALAGLIDWQYRDGLKLWMQKRLKISRVRTAREAWLVIEGLKKMFANKMAKLWGKDWWRKDFDDPGVARFIKEHCGRRTEDR
jgi:phage gp16-like protein